LLAGLRREGIAYSLEEFTPGIIRLAKAVLGEDGEALGSLNVALPANQFARRYDGQGWVLPDLLVA
jgi:DNA-binding IclR family transcriptional regulator